MKEKTKFYITIAPVIFIVIILAGYILYTPPLLNGRGYNIPGRLYDFIAYAYYSSRMEWLKNGGDVQALRRAAARAAWHRPDRMEELLGISDDNLFLLGREYAGLGLNKAAVQLFRAAFSGLRPAGPMPLRIISNLALLGDWSGVASAARELIKLPPESGRTNYWLGRALLERGEADQAAVFLRKAVSLDPEFADAFYQSGWAEEELGSRDTALAQYQQAVKILPGHRGGWSALRRLYQENGERAKLEEAESRLKNLTPEVPLRIVWEDRLILRGYNFSQSELRTGDRLNLTLFIEGREFSSGKVQPELTFSSSSHPGRISLKGKIIPTPSMGEVVKVVVSREIPLVLYPGSIQMDISIYDPELGGGLETGGAKSLGLVSFNLSPGWNSFLPRNELIKSHFGSGARSLGEETFLGPGTEIMIDFKGQGKISGLGLISFGHTSSFLPQGSLLGEIVVNPDHGEELVLPIIVGIHTAEVWREYALPWQRKHRPAAIYRSWPINSRGKEFMAHEYYTVYSFPYPRIIRDIQIRNVSRNSGLYIRNLILIPLHMPGT